jgi:hypothetical protein
MDEDSKVIEELRVICEQQRGHIVQLERALKIEMAKQEESKKIINDEHLRSNEQIEDLKYKLANCMNALESKDVELVNLQTALGQYYAESEAKVIGIFCTILALKLNILYWNFQPDFGPPLHIYSGSNWG